MPNTVQQNIAYQVLIAIGFSAESALPGQKIGGDLEQSIVATARLMPTMNELAYTEDYFYEEIVFASLLGLEAEIGFQFISFVIEAWRQDKGLAQEISPSEVYGGLKDIAYPVACARMGLVGIDPTPLTVEEGFEERFFARFSEYEGLAKAQLACDRPVEKQALAVGLSRREHPWQQYLGAVSDHICEVLVGQAEAVDQTAIEYAVMLKWNTVMATARQCRETR